MKFKILGMLLISGLFSLSSLAETYNFDNDYKYKDILLQNNIIAKNWCAAKSSEIPAKLLIFKVAGTDIIEKNKSADDSNYYLAPLEIIEFRKNGVFNFYWYKNNYEAGNITGYWKIENSLLILSFSKDYIAPYLKNSELRYEITGTDYLKTKLLLKGMKYSPATEILNTTDDILNDFEKIVISEEQKTVSVRFPQIIKEKELELRKSLLNK